ncbi:uncharacterized protein DFL_005131 [Arthrobotrys flagrans]|uniref:GID complex catalytic subunit 2 n=1 Tax=Arthrobotrys flagrans TaxID=97331 RepID=A0A437A6Y3_ARTFL|nr:hypothetical protein DFL_005131 [Arthrobotrys flagrans]
MDVIEKELDKLTNGGANLSKSIKDIDKCLEILMAAKATIEKDPRATVPTLQTLESELKTGFQAANDNLKGLHAGIGKYGKALDKKFKHNNNENTFGALANRQPLINRAIQMHLLREGNFEIADMFAKEAGIAESVPSVLEVEFRELFSIQESLRRKELKPAIEWAAKRRDLLEARASNLEFDLHRLQYLVFLFNGGADDPVKALEYSKSCFLPFQKKYLPEISQLAGCLLWRERLSSSPYAALIQDESSWQSIIDSFTTEFCALLRLSAESPLYVATTAGAIALPTFNKMATIMKAKKTEWTSQNELPVEVPLPDKFKYHSIFVCPVSKEQTTDSNPPMMIPCGHVLAKDTVQKLARGTGSRYKCPYCPADSLPKEAREIYL